jgi:hypothetical protein
VALVGTASETGGFCVVPGSHLRFSELSQDADARVEVQNDFHGQPVPLAYACFDELRQDFDLSSGCVAEFFQRNCSTRASWWPSTLG